MTTPDQPNDSPRYCTCGCGLTVGDGNWARGLRTCSQLRELARRSPRR